MFDCINIQIAALIFTHIVLLFAGIVIILDNRRNKSYKDYLKEKRK